MKTSDKAYKSFDLSDITRAKELKSKFLYTILLLLVYRLGTYIPIPSVNALALDYLTNVNSTGILGMFNMLSGGSLGRMSIFALTIMPYITASIIMQLLSVVIPSMENIKKEGESGRKKINQYTRYLTVILASFQAFGISVGLEHMTANNISVVDEPGFFFRFTTTVTLVGGTMFLLWLGDKITTNGIGNGTSLIIFTGIVSGLPKAFVSTFELSRTGAISPFLILLIFSLIILLLYFIVFFEKSFRKLIVQYPKKQIGNSVYNGDVTHMPIKLNCAGVIPPIFASSLLLFPMTIVNFMQNSAQGSSILEEVALYLGHGKPLYILLYLILIIFFCFFYTAIVFNPTETAENLKKNGGFIPGRRPGKSTADYLDYILVRLTVLGSIYISSVCIIPELLMSKYSVPFYLGGTSILIVVNVILDSVSQIQTHLFAHKYESLLKKANLKRGKSK